MPKAAATVHGVLCDTSYFIRWAKPNEVLHPAAHDYLKFLVEGGHEQFALGGEVAHRGHLGIVPISLAGLVEEVVNARWFEQGEENPETSCRSSCRSMSTMTPLLCFSASCLCGR